MNKLTIKDIAKLLQLSASTVSRALSDHPDISIETRNRVKEVAEGMNYKKNLHASFFRKNKSGLINLILPEINMFYSPKMIKSINNLITPSNYSLIISLTNNSLEKENEIIDKCIKWQVEGVILCLSKETENLNHIQKLKKADIPCVLLDKTIDNTDFPLVTIDNELTSYNALNYLMANGHQNILGIFDSIHYSITKERIRGFQNAIIQNQIPERKSEILTLENIDTLEENILQRIKNKTFTAIFTMSDELLAKTVFILQKHQIAIPNEVSLISISDGVYPYLVYPNITHIKDSGNKVGKLASKTLLDLIENPKTPILHQKAETKLVELNSVKKV